MHAAGRGRAALGAAFALKHVGDAESERAAITGKCLRAAPRHAASRPLPPLTRQKEKKRKKTEKILGGCVCGL